MMPVFNLFYPSQQSELKNVLITNSLDHIDEEDVNQTSVKEELYLRQDYLGLYLLMKS